MGFAMFMATGSFFLGQAKIFPEPIRKLPLLAVPVLLVVVTVLYWIVRVLFMKRRAHSLVHALDISQRREQELSTA